jgi:outer membrane murein-binding lipoprotein Lpp
MSEESTAAGAVGEHTQRIEELERQVKTLSAAVHALAEGLMPDPVGDQPGLEAAEDGARFAHDLLIAAGL